MKHYASSSLFATDRLRRFYEREERESKVLDEFFWNCFEYLHANSVAGDYLEFGSGFLARSIRLAAKYRLTVHKIPRLMAFDSFEGLPDIPEGEIHPNWKKGDMAMSLEDFKQLLELQGVGSDEYVAVPGLFEKTLRVSPIEYGIHRASFAFVDCDLYSSTKQVLSFLGPVIFSGTIVAFDDWNCYCADPRKGQRRAFAEFLEAFPALEFQPFLSLGWHGQSFICNGSREKEQYV